MCSARNRVREWLGSFVRKGVYWSKIDQNMAKAWGRTLQGTKWLILENLGYCDDGLETRERARKSWILFTFFLWLYTAKAIEWIQG